MYMLAVPGLSKVEMEFFFYIVGFLVLIFAFKVLCFRDKIKLPPSPWGLPLLGHLHLLGRMPHRSLQALSQKFGDLMFLRFGTVPAIVISSPKVAKAVLKVNDMTFSSRPYLMVGEINGYNFKGMAVTSGEQWKSMRKICTTELFTARRIDSFKGVQFGEVLNAILYLTKNHQSIINVREVLTAISFNTITQILLSKKFFGEHASEDEIEEANDFKEVIAETIQIAFQLHISEFLPSWLRWIDWSRHQARKLVAKQDKFFQKVFDDRRSNKTIRSTDDFLDTLLQLKEDEDAVKAILMEILSAGTDTSACTLEWTLLELLRNQDIMTKLQKEMAAVVERDHMVTESDLPNLPYLTAVVKETLRLHTPTPLLVPRMSSQACVLAGYNIPKGATTIVNFYAISRDPRFWKRPSMFWPERFEGSVVDFKGQDFELIPFGAGRRICPGMTLGLKTVYLTLANFLHCFNWSCVPGRSYEVEEIFGAVAWPKVPLHAHVTPRQNIVD